MSAAPALTEAHRLAQARIGANVVRQSVAVWKLIDPADLDASTPAWLRVQTGVIRDQRRRSAELAASYFRTLRSIELGADITLELASNIDETQVATSLLVTGPIRVKSALARGVELVRALDLGQAASAAASMRHTLNGGRDTITAATSNDPRAVGWQRVTSGNPCEFCLMLAGRGAVYNEQTAGFESHDSCSCAAEPVFQ